MVVKSSAAEPLLLRQQNEGVVTLRMNRPLQFNALSEPMLDALSRELESIASVHGVAAAASSQLVAAVAQDRRDPDEESDGRSLRQVDVLPTTPDGLGRRLRWRRHGAQHDGRGRLRRHRDT